jgi:hypothetical protein
MVITHQLVDTHLSVEIICRMEIVKAYRHNENKQTL